MIIGLLLAIAVSVSIASAGIILIELTGNLKENLVTGAVIGTTGIVSYSVIALILALIAAFFLSLILKKPVRVD